MIRILIVDDSATIRTLLKAIFESDPEMLVVGMASNGVEAAAQTALLKPDVITMDILMPVMNGFEATRRIMAENPTPIVVVTSHVDSVELNTTFNAIKAGVAGGGTAGGQGVPGGGQLRGGAMVWGPV